MTGRVRAGLREFPSQRIDRLDHATIGIGGSVTVAPELHAGHLARWASAERAKSHHPTVSFVRILGSGRMARELPNGHDLVTDKIVASVDAPVSVCDSALVLVQRPPRITLVVDALNTEIAHHASPREPVRNRLPLPTPGDVAPKRDVRRKMVIDIYTVRLAEPHHHL